MIFQQNRVWPSEPSLLHGEQRWFLGHFTNVAETNWRSKLRLPWQAYRSSEKKKAKVLEGGFNKIP